jgi:hypothetical protein
MNTINVYHGQLKPGDRVVSVSRSQSSYRESGTDITYTVEREADIDAAVKSMRNCIQSKIDELEQNGMINCGRVEGNPGDHQIVVTLL